MSKKTTFAVIADLHVDIMHDAEERLKSFLAAARAADVDFIIQLGDFCYPDEGRRCVCAPEKRPENIEAALKFPTYADKESIHALYLGFEKPSYHVIGNHDCDMCSKRQVLDYYRADYEPYYSFDCGAFHFIALDPNYYKKDGKYVSYECGNYFDEAYHAVSVLPYLPHEQLVWLKKDLDSTDLPSVIFTHQCLKEGEAGAILNANEFKEAIKGRRSRVVACFSGHSHIDYAVRDNGVWYMHINSASSFWMGNEYTCLGRYGSEIDEKYPSIRYVAPYSKPLYAIIELDERGASIKGTNGEFVGKSPDELGWYKGKAYDKASSPKIEVKPCIEDRYLPFE
jgi:3',5'-cyclic AMP phosphodiesterase CpdA